MSRRCPMMSRRSGLVLGRFLAYFEPIIVGFKAQTQRRRGENLFGRFGRGETPYGMVLFGEEDGL